MNYQTEMRDIANVINEKGYNECATIMCVFNSMNWLVLSTLPHFYCQETTDASAASTHARTNRYPR